MRGEDLVVVGVDGSESAQAALEFALEEAARRSARVRVVTAFQPVDYWPVGYGIAGGMIVPPTTAELTDEAERTARQAVAEATAEVGQVARAVPVEVRVASGSPGEVLVDEAARADLLVVGHRGRGGFASVCLGSVGLHCVLHATCPVAVIRSAPASTALSGAAAYAGEART